MLGMFGFILGGIGCLIYCGRTKTFLFYSGMKYHSMTKLGAILVLIGLSMFMVDVIFIPLLG